VIRRAALIVLLLVAAACTSSEGGSEPRPTATAGGGSGPTPTEPSPSEPPSPEQTPVTSIELVAPRGGSFLVHGRYPLVDSDCVDPTQPRLDGRYPGTLVVERADDGTFSLVATIPFDAYLEGIAEVPASWPRAALEAQAIAARTYALATTRWSGKEGAELEEPICSTSACQVYGGMPIDRTRLDRRWDRAVRDTDGQVLLFEGRPAETLYFSTSNGQTYGNEDVFGSAPLPYLRPVVERDDGASGLSHWSTRIPYGDLATFLHAAGEWGKDEIVAVFRLAGGEVAVRGAVESETMDLSTFRDAVNAWAHCLEPQRYPGSLPTTIPSRWFRIASTRGGVTITGRGWGHGVGMVQWGAYGRARRGLSAEEILAYYYGGLRPERYPEPGLIHVEIADGLRSLRLDPSRPGAEVNGEPVEGPVVIREGLEVLVG